ncbi:MAG: tRNA pseudouridine(38-40) synthase TruA [Rhodobiaceae bacterium]|nr:tRNA pseudouridine(38-40) synthase TruA [Rhodobiaceae bacterium]MCC0013911.1 tRNA pseudouridine(38-40) synthase TruA [Rhodobiaceae bacterium]MCC0017870.1 tRNA pseudouridine(38-40) synthase TruA [Rhodobiaceae bacterium]MCC0062425.1 tRNA pseudouridine(38-40) synthase TruA [Rhodobiaceae bacterium]
MPRYKLTIEYDGTPFLGWQMQADGRTVQGVLAEALKKFSGEGVIPGGAGRTDTGVHALGQVAHVDLEKAWPTDTVRDALNAHLRPDPVSILSAEIVSDDFDARFSATARHYRYLIVNRRPPLALMANRAWLVHVPLDADAMADAAQVLIGNHDFTTFRAAACQAKSPVKTLDTLTVRRSGETVIIEAKARSFLHHQVRSFAGALKFVGEGKWTKRDLREALEARDRAQCPPLAPSAGLYLVQVDY